MVVRIGPFSVGPGQSDESVYQQANRSRYLSDLKAHYESTDRVWTPEVEEVSYTQWLAEDKAFNEQLLKQEKIDDAAKMEQIRTTGGDIGFEAAGLGGIYQGLKERDSANQALAHGHYSRGMVHLEASEIELAEAEFEQAIRVSPNTSMDAS